MIDRDTPRIESTDWQSSRLRDNTDFLINEAPLDGLLAMFHSAAERENIGSVKVEFIKTLVQGRYVQAQVQSMDRLTMALEGASRSSTRIGTGLIVVSVAAVIVAVVNSFM